MTKKDNFKPVQFFEKGHKWQGRPRCTAWARSANDGQGGQCGKIAGQSGKCSMHGDKSPRGTESPNWKHGAYEGRGKVNNHFYQNIANTRWRSAYMRFQKQAEILSLSSDVLLNAARIDEQIGALGNLPTYKFLDDLGEVLDQMKAGMIANDPQVVASGISAIIRMVAQAREDLIGMDKLDRLIGQRMDLVTREQRAIEKQEKHLAIGQVVGLVLRLFGLITDVIERNTDPASFTIIMDSSRLALRDSLIYLGSETMMQDDDVIEGESTSSD